MKRLTGFSPRLFTICTHLVVTVAIVLGCASTLAAQDRLFALQKGSGSFPGARLVEVDTRPEAFGHVRKVFQVGSYDALDHPTSIGGGRYVVWLSEGGLLHVFDTQAEGHFTLAGVVPPNSKILAADAAGLRLFVLAPGALLIIDGAAGTVRQVSPPAPDRWVFGVATYAASARRLYVASRRVLGLPPSDAIDVIDVDAGVIEKTLTVSPLPILGLGVDSDASRLFVGVTSGFPPSERSGLYVYDPRTGAQLAHHTSPLLSGLSTPETQIQIDEARRRALVKTIDGSRPGTRLAAFDLDSLQLLGSVEGRNPVWNDGSLTPVHALTGPRSPLYVFSSSLATADTCATAHFERLDPTSGAQQQQVEVASTWGAGAGGGPCLTELLLLTSPVTPNLQSPQVSGSTVTLTWRASANALHYDLEFGSAPGLANLGVSPAHTGTVFTIGGVPSGTYYARVRAINTIGRSLPSNEVEVVVP